MGTRTKWRDEYAPREPEPPDPIAQLVRALSTSEAKTLALDATDPARVDRLELRRIEAEREAAERAADAATRRRRQAEVRESRWRPKTRRDLEAARADEVTARDRVTELRSQHERQAQRVEALEPQAPRTNASARTLLRRLERDALGARDLGRSMER